MFRMSSVNQPTHIHILSQHMCRIGGNGPNVRAVTVKSLASSTRKVAKHRRITFETKTLPGRVERYHPVAELQDLHHRFPCQILIEFLSLGPKTFSAIPTTSLMCIMVHLYQHTSISQLHHICGTSYAEKASRRTFATAALLVSAAVCKAVPSSGQHLNL